MYMKRQPDRAFVRVDGGAEGRLRHQHFFAADLLLMEPIAEEVAAQPPCRCVWN